MGGATGRKSLMMLWREGSRCQRWGDAVEELGEGGGC